MTKYHFERHLNLGNHSAKKMPNTVSVNTCGLYIGREAYKSLGNPKRLGIWVDKGNKAIRLTSNQRGGLIVKMGGGCGIRTTSLHKELPKGQYHRARRWIYRHKEVRQKEGK